MHGPSREAILKQPWHRTMQMFSIGSNTCVRILTSLHNRMENCRCDSPNLGTDCRGCLLCLSCSLVQRVAAKKIKNVQDTLITGQAYRALSSLPQGTAELCSTDSTHSAPGLLVILSLERNIQLSGFFFELYLTCCSLLSLQV